LITRILLKDFVNRTCSLSSFYSRRVLRIFPILIVILTACFLAGQFTLFADEYRQMANHIAAGAGFVSNFVFWSEAGYFDNASGAKPLLHLWSLGIEEQFYLLWPLLLSLVWRKSSLVLSATLVVLICSFAFGAHTILQDKVEAFYAPWSRFWELMMGSALASAQQRANAREMLGALLVGRILDQTVNRNVISLAGLGLILWAAFKFDEASDFPGWLALFPTVGATLVIAAGPAAFPNRRFLSSKPMVGIGLVSYGLYMWHWPVLVFANHLNEFPLSGLQRLLTLFLSMNLAIGSYFLFEKPLRTRRHVNIKVVVLCALMASIAGSAYLISKNPDTQTLLSRDIKFYSLNSDEISVLWRRNRCMLETQKVFSSECAAEPGKAPIVFLWGDSHAAALYPALTALQKKAGFRLAQYTASRCPPIFDYVSPFPRWNNPNCAEINAIVRDEIIAQRPRTVILEAFWRRYSVDGLEATLHALKAMGVRDIILVGDIPMAGYDLRRSVVRHRYDTGVSIDNRASFFLLPGSDSRFAAIAREEAATFVSPTDVLCEADRCTALYGDTRKTLVFIDDDHLSPEGAMLIIDRLRIWKGNNVP
jgi:peptidoglycan/LPS O-acetylase OafA/YrhL